ncbi:DUF2147 domain-containing protein [Camelimonas abortus]|uniref:DUF2147 domain-containing protein n=1 Tax=Camelimonas abortus TaxID=1017184 RepID=A0ABV7LDQ6_9HYPH
MWKQLTCAAVLGLAAAGAPARAQDPAAVAGVWLTESGDTRVRMQKCGDTWCGVIVWTRIGDRDVNNQDPTLRNRPLVGLQMITGTPDPASGGFSGKLYNLLDGKTYSGKLQLTGPNTLKLTGCVLGGLICRSQTWTRVR